MNCTKQPRSSVEPTPAIPKHFTIETRLEGLTQSRERSYAKFLQKKEQITIPLHRASDRRLWRRRIVAAVLVVGLFTTLVFGLLDFLPQELVYRCEAGQVLKVTLPDQTTVWLNAGSKLCCPATFDKHARRVTLNGEAYFRVRHHEAWPFLVQTDKSSIRVLGTTFNVRAYRYECSQTTILVKGSVEVEPVNVSMSVVKVRLNPNQQAVISACDPQVAVSTVDPSSALAWRLPEFVFHANTFREIVERVGAHFGITHVEIRNKELEKERFTGKFKDPENLEAVFEVMRESIPFTYVITDQVLIIKSSNL